MVGAEKDGNTLETPLRASNTCDAMQSCFFGVLLVCVRILPDNCESAIRYSSWFLNFVLLSLEIVFLINSTILHICCGVMSMCLIRSCFSNFMSQSSFNPPLVLMG